MRKGALILLLGLLLGTAAFCGFFYLGTAGSRQILQAPEPELAWLKRQFNLGDAEFARISKLHEAYLPQCAERCRHIEELNQKLAALLAQATNVSPEIEGLLLERSRMRANCETEMLKHFVAVSQTMPPAQGRRYLEWVERETCLKSQAMEQRHHQDASRAGAQEHHHHE